MNRYDETENVGRIESDLGYSRIDPETLRLRCITEDEFAVIPNKYKSSSGLLLSKPVIAFIVCVIFSAAMMISAVSDIINKDADAGMYLFISSMVSLLLISVSWSAVIMHRNRFVSRESLVTAGEVVQMTFFRGSRTRASYAVHVIALHGSRQLVVIKDKYPIPVGATVLIVKTRDLQLCLYNVPSQAVDYDREQTDFSEEIDSGGDLPLDDYSKYDKVTILEAQKSEVSGEEYSQLPVKFRSPRPLSYGLPSVAWAITTLVTVGSLVTMIRAKMTDNSDAFVVALVILFCIILLEWVLTIYVFKTQLPKKTTCCIECIPIRKLKNSGNCYISVIIPDKRQYIDRILVEPEAFGMINENEHYKMYFNFLLPTIKHVHSVYDKY